MFILVICAGKIWKILLSDMPRECKLSRKAYQRHYNKYRTAPLTKLLTRPFVLVGSSFAENFQSGVPSDGVLSGQLLFSCSIHLSQHDGFWGVLQQLGSFFILWCQGFAVSTPMEHIIIKYTLTCDGVTIKRPRQAWEVNCTNNWTITLFQCTWTWILFLTHVHVVCNTSQIR